MVSLKNYDVGGFGQMFLLIFWCVLSSFGWEEIRDGNLASTQNKSKKWNDKMMEEMQHYE